MRITFNKAEVAEVLVKHVEVLTKEQPVTVVASSLPDDLEVIVDTGGRATLPPASAKDRFASIFKELNATDQGQGVAAEMVPTGSEQ